MELPEAAFWKGLKSLVLTMQTAWILLLASLGLSTLAGAQKGLEFPRYDGKDRVLDMNEKNYHKALKKYDMLCLFYHAPLPTAKELQKQLQLTELVLEVREDKKRVNVWCKI